MARRAQAAVCAGAEVPGKDRASLNFLLLLNAQFALNFELGLRSAIGFFVKFSLNDAGVVLRDVAEGLHLALCGLFCRPHTRDLIDRTVHVCFLLVEILDWFARWLRRPGRILLIKRSRT